MTPTARTLAWLREQGHTCGVVERNTLVMERHESGRVSKRFHKNDLFGFIDVVSLDGEHTIGWQATSGGNVAARVAKIRAHENLPAVLRAGWKVRVIGWTKYAKPVDRKRWRERVVEVTGGEAGEICPDCGAPLVRPGMCLNCGYGRKEADRANPGGHTSSHGRF